MGQAVSQAARARDVSKGLVITFDALGTIYKFKEPVGKQYLDVARSCGLQAHLTPEDVAGAFKASYKEHAASFPNYGKGIMKSPDLWWNSLIVGTFSRLVDEKDLPPQLGARLYDHFSSANAYEPFSDVRPFLQALQRLRNKLSNIDGPAVIVGVISNSDPRVRAVLKSMGFNLGNVQQSTLIENAASIPEEMLKSRQPHFRPPWHDAYNAERDFDFLTTSYECGSMKPDQKIFLDAQKQASVVMLARKSADLKYTGIANSMGSLLSTIKHVSRSVEQVSQMQFIHIGDDLVEDYDGAKAFGIEALLLDRDGRFESKTGKITSLQEAATVVELLVAEGMKLDL